mgnify:CR=1 FL=1
MAIPAAAFKVAHNLGRMAGDVFRGAQGIVNSPYAIPIAVGLGQAGIAGVHGRMTGYGNPTHSGIPGALGHTVLGMSPLAGLAYYVGQRTGSKNKMEELSNQYQPLVAMQGYNQMLGNI